jgi:hypothetical protein
MGDKTAREMVDTLNRSAMDMAEAGADPMVVFDMLDREKMSDEEKQGYDVARSIWNVYDGNLKDFIWALKHAKKKYEKKRR